MKRLRRSVKIYLVIFHPIFTSILFHSVVSLYIAIILKGSSSSFISNSAFSLLLLKTEVSDSGIYLLSSFTYYYTTLDSIYLGSYS